jgi:hypothetical protein
MTRHPTRRAGVYVLVLTTSAVTMTIAMIGMATISAQREAGELTGARSRAAILAESAINLAVERIDTDSAWRDASGGVLVDVTVDGARITAEAIDPADGDLANDAGDAFTLTGSAQLGGARQRLAVDFSYTQVAVEGLSYPLILHGGAGGGGSLCVFAWSMPLPVCGGLILAQIKDVFPAVSMSWIDLPDPSVVQQYAAMGTPISTDCSAGGRGKVYPNLVLSSDSGPGGGTPDPRAIYVLDGCGNDVILNSPRIAGTLVVINAQSVSIQQPRVFRSGPEGLPIILAHADVYFVDAGTSSIDATAPDTDDDPSGPDFDDPTFDGMQGIIYVDGNIDASGYFDLRGTLMATGAATFAGASTITANPLHRSNPPEGFTVADELRMVAGSWRAVVD